MPRPESTRTSCICQVCGTTFRQPPSRIRDGKGKYCSRRCKDESQRGLASCTCPVCGMTFSRKPHRVRPERDSFCSKRCWGASCRTSLPCICQVCGCTFMATPSLIKRTGAKYCSRGCQGNGKNNRLRRTCETCGSIFTARPSQIKLGHARFCCADCRYRSGRLPGSQPSRWELRAYRRTVWERDAGVCHICQTFVPYGPGYHLGHIVDFCMGGDDTIENLAVMCQRCNLTKPRHRTREEYEAWRQVIRT